MIAPPKIAIVGAGIEGAGAAFYMATRHGLTPTIFDPEPFSGASQVAAGMLAPVAEAVYGEERLLEMMLEAAREWSRLDEALRAAGLESGYRGGGSLLVASGPNDVAEIERTHAYYLRLGLAVKKLRAAQARELEPALSPATGPAIYTEIDNQVDNRVAHRSLLTGALKAGATLIERRVAEVSRHKGGWALFDDQGAEHHFDKVVIAAGVRSGEIGGLPGYMSKALRPIRGQVLRLRAAPGSGPSLVVRSLWDGRLVYVVPRLNGEVVIGATAEEVGFDPTRKARSTYELLRDTFKVLPGLGEADLAEVNVGFRPGTSDNFPILGEAEDGLYLDTGHFRHGILLASITGRWIAEAVASGRTPEGMSLFGPARLGARR